MIFLYFKLFFEFLSFYILSFLWTWHLDKWIRLIIWIIEFHAYFIIYLLYIFKFRLQYIWFLSWEEYSCNTWNVRLYFIFISFLRWALLWTWLFIFILFKKCSWFVFLILLWIYFKRLVDLQNSYFLIFLLIKNKLILSILFF